MKKILLTQQGFTLVELLAVMMVFGIISGIAGSVLITSLRSSTKTTVIANIKQNGNFAISQMVKSIESAKALISPFPCVPSTTGKSLTFVDQYGVTLQYACSDAANNPPVPPDTTNTIASNGASLLDTNAVTVVKNSCSFTCTQASKSDYPVIGISFTLSQAGAASFTESAASVPFSTSVVFRNFVR